MGGVPIVRQNKEHLRMQVLSGVLLYAEASKAVA